MERKISVSELRKAVEEAYAAVEPISEGAIDPRNLNAAAGQFGISVALTDGTVINKGDTDVKAPMGSIMHLPLHSVLFSQAGVDAIVKKSGKCPACALGKNRKGWRSAPTESAPSRQSSRQATPNRNGTSTRTA